MEKQSTSKFLRSVIAVVALFMLAVSGFLLTSCKHVHSEPNDFGACTDCGSIIDWDKFGSQMSTLLDPSFDDLTASLTDLASEVTEVKGDVDSIIGALNVADDGSDIDTIVKNVQAVLDQIENLIGANPSVAAKATAPTITGIANAVTSVQETLNKIGAGNIEHVCENHQFDTETPVIEIEPTCERAGAKVYRCVNCNATIALPVNQLEHVAADEPVKENVVAPTCTTDGSYDLVYYCKNGCGEPLSTEHVVDPQKGHDWDKENPVTMQPATCTEAGSAVYTCKVCGAQSEEFVLPATGHSYDWTTPVSEVAPKCEVEGSATYKCANCENTITLKPSDEEKPESMTDEQWTAFVAAYKATGHNYTNDDGTENFVWKYGDDIDFSVNEITATKYLVCTVCGQEEAAKGTDGKPVTEQQVHIWKVDTVKTEAQANIKKLAETDEGYDKSYYGYVNTSCQASAYVYWICEDSNCKLHADDFGFPIEVELKPVEHVWVANPEKPNILPTCETEGHNYWICSVGGEEWDEVIEANGHSWDEDTVIDEKPATCTEDGFRTYKCTVCGKTQTDTIPALGHDKVVDTVYEKIDGNTHKVTTTTTCSRENCDYKEVVEKTESHYEGESMLNPTTREEAEEIAEEFELEVYEKDGKFYFTDAGCDRSGFIMNVCACGHSERDWNSYVPALKHDWSEGEYIEGSCVTAGKIQYTCERCGEIYIETVQTATGHVWEVVAAKDPTCDTNGWKRFAYCETCGAVIAIADGEKPNQWTTDYVEGITCDGTEEEIEAVKDLEGIKIDATGHTWSEKPMVFCEDGCLSPVWEVTYCVTCFNYDEEGDFTIKANGAEYPESAEGYVDTDFGAATDEFITELLNILNWAGSDDHPPVSFTKEQLLSDEFNGHYNITGIKFVAAAGHELNKTQSDDKTDAIVCLTDKALVTYTDALEFAKKVYPSVNEDDFKAAFNAIFGDGAADNTEFKIDVTGETTPTLAGICTECGMPVETVPHDEQYYMFELGYDAGTLTEPKYTPYDYTVALKGVGEDGVDVNKVIVNTQKYLVKDAEGNMLYADEKAIADNKYTKVVFTLDEIISMGYYNMDEHNEFMAVNCYFEGFCARNCGTDLGHKSEHTFPTSDNYDKYHNCMHGDICVWCTNLMRNADEHNLQNLEEISAYGDRYAAAVEKLYNSGFEWVGKDTVGEVDCKNEGKDYTITVCVSCLLAWAEGDPNFDTWTENVNYTSKVELANGDHKFVLVKSGDPNSKNCLVGYFEKYVCEVCGYQLEHTDTFEYAEQEINSLNEFDYVAETYLPTKLHTVAPVAGYWLNDNYEAATDADPAYMNFICVDCGARIQGYYDGVNDAGEVVYNMATDAQIQAYLDTAGAVAPAFDKVANWGNIQVVRAVDKAAVTTVEFAADATEDQKKAAVAKAIADAEKEGATSVYLTIPGDIKFGASDTTTFTEGEATVWQAYGITFSADSSVKKIVLDLGGNKLTFAGTMVDEKSEATVGATYKITGEGSVIFSNGTIEFTAFTKEQNTFAFNANTTELVFDNITATVKGGAVFAGFGSNGEEAVGTMTIKDSKITTEGYYVVSTNASDWQNSKVVINIIDSTLTSTQPDNDSVGIMFNVPGELNVSGSFVTADSQGMIIRGGDIKATIKDTEVTITGDCSEANVEGYDKYESKDWGSGNNLPMGAFVIGDRSTSYEVGLATVVLEEVTINAPEDVNKVYVYAQEGDTTVDLTITNCGLEAADIVNGSNANDAEVYKLTIDGAQVVPAPVVDEGNTEEAQG